MRIRGSSFAIGLLFCSLSEAASAVCGASAVNNPNVDAAVVLQACLPSGAGVVELLPGRYYFQSTLSLGARSDLKFQTKGITSGPPCLAPNAPACAILTASANNPGATLIQSSGARGLSFQYIAFDGNLAHRRATITNQQWPPGTGYNAKIHNCSECRFEGFASVRAPQGTGLEFSGDDAVFERVLFRDNGWGFHSDPLGRVGRHSDGLTVLSSARLRIVNSAFIDNSDIDLIVGHAPHAVIEGNFIGNSYNYAFGALMLDNFNGSTGGDFTGALVRNNRIFCPAGMCGLGIMIGPHMWYPSKSITGGRITANKITGARQGLLVSGAIGTEIDHNDVTQAKSYSVKDFKTSAIAFSPGDTVSIHDNSQSAGDSRLLGCTPQDLARALPLVSDIDGRVAQAYRDILARDPDDEGGRYYSQSLRAGWSVTRLRDWLARSAEGVQVIDRLYRRVLGRPVDATGLQASIDLLKGGGNSSQLYMLLQLSTEGIAKSDRFEAWADFGEVR